ncbi:FecCD family ABC transporter permease [Psychromicrobium xiongbiense]|uniref:FecCD family ABC transporter permease n=1 Tax=Psychromicrobium xiongbiense TaxID=3051184 RepID=UPI002553158D|nr:iron ABC transporter permease [Psychromicrobium sp. YIM S02556]
MTVRRRRLLILGALGLALLLAALLSMAVGARSVPLATVAEVLGNLGAAPHGGAGGAGGALTSGALTSGDMAVVQSRIPRTMAALLVGACLGLAGTAMQGMVRNPLADPGLLGINSGAALAVVCASAFLGLQSITGYLWFAFLGSALAAIVVYAVASLGRGGATPVKLALAGAALTAGLSSLVSAVLITHQNAFDAFRNWQVGSFAGAGWPELVAVLPLMALGVLLVVFAGRWLNALALGDDLARGLGQRPAVARAVTALGVVLLCGSATALAGPIGFIGLVVPHLLRAFGGADYQWLLPGSLLVAPLLVVLADVVGRMILLPGEVSAGVVAVFLGAPVFIWLVRGRQAVAL